MADEPTNDVAALPVWVLSNAKLYDFLKAIALVWLPGFATLYFALAGIWGLPGATQVIGTITAVDTFLGVILKISTSKYNASDAKYSGDVTIANDDGVYSITKLAINPDTDLSGNQQMLFKVVPPDVPIGDH